MSANSFPQLSDQPPWPRRRLILYYRAHGVLVTSRQLIVGAEHYEIAELIDIAQGRGSRHPGAVIAMIIAPLLGVIRTPVVWLLGGVALTIPCLVGLVCVQRWPAQYELVAWYRGQQHILLTTRDSREFGQVSRALIRAMEARDES